LIGIIFGFQKAIGTGIFNDDLSLFSFIDTESYKVIADRLHTLSLPVTTSLFDFHSGTIVAIYYIVSTCFAGLLLYKLLEMVYVVRGNSSTLIGGMYVFQSPFFNTPFTFFNRIFLNQDTDLHDSSTRIIIKHEAVHARQWHTVDLLLTEFLLLFTWFFPIVLLYKKELTLLHEYQADAHVLKFMPVKDYGVLLLSQRMGSALSMVHHLANSDLKKRFLKMVQPASAAWKKWSFAAMVPATALVIGLISLLDFNRLQPVVSQKKEVSGSNYLTREIYINPEGQWRVVKGKNEGSQYVPSYPGGRQALTDYLVRHLNIDEYYKKQAGDILIRLNLDAQGRVELVTFLKPVGPEMEKALTETFINMPQWIAPKYQGKDVRSVIEIPIRFVR